MVTPAHFLKEIQNIKQQEGNEDRCIEGSIWGILQNGQQIMKNDFFPTVLKGQVSITESKMSAVSPERVDYDINGESREWASPD